MEMSFPEKEVMKLAMYEVKDTLVPAEIKLSADDVALVSRDLVPTDYSLERTVSASPSCQFIFFNRYICSTIPNKIASSLLYPLVLKSSTFFTSMFVGRIHI